MSNLSIIIGREYRERVRQKSFIVTTLLMPIFMIALMVAPALIMKFATPDHNVLGVIDNSGVIAQDLKSTELFDIVNLSVPGDTAIKNGDVDGYFIIPADIVTNKKSTVNLLMNGVIPMELQTVLNTQINNSVENHRLLAYNIQDLPTILEEVKADVTINEIRLDKDEGESLSSSVSFFIGLAMALILYMFLLMYGQMIMTSIIEEKNNRVLELVVSSVKPMQLMLGKILGVGLVAVTQIVLWGAILGFVASFLLPSLITADMMNEIASYRAGNLDPTASMDYEMISSLSTLTNVGFIAELFAWLILFLVGGFLLYASMFAAIGSAVDNIQDSSQFSSYIVLPIVLGFLFTTSIGNAPNSAAAVWLSMIPFTSPMVTMSRIAFGIDAWQIWVSLVILYASFIGMAWLAGKIYRVGIFMYGKKPNIKDLIKWARYK